MDRFIINGERKLSGSVQVHGAKNSVLPILAASLVSEKKSIIHNCPYLSDVEASIKILNYLGCKAERKGDTVYIDSSNIERCDIPDHLMREMRSSVIFLGAILGRTGCAEMTFPGGCELGERPIDLHIAALRELGAVLDDSGGRIRCRTGDMCGTEINLAFPSVGATENIMLAACRCKGETVITNAAKEPEIVDLQNYLCAMGAKVEGAGTSTIRVCGTKKYHDAEYTVMPDRIVAATYMAAAASAGGEVEIRNVVPENLRTITEVFRGLGCEIKDEKMGLFIKRTSPLKASRPIVTMPYPGFPTDAQAPLMAACLKAMGTTVFIENIFESRFRHVPELLRFGADIQIEGRVALVCGVNELYGTSVKATDLRGGAALVIAALGAKGESEISGLHHIDRGYQDLDVVLRSLGADILRL